VFAAADQLLAGGERPTVECIRAALGSGSPNTVIRHLDAWWAGAGRRLRAKASLPAMRDAAAELVSALWAQAMQAATTLAQESAAASQACPVEVERRHFESHKQSLREVAQRDAETLGRTEQAIATLAA